MLKGRDLGTKFMMWERVLVRCSGSRRFKVYLMTPDMLQRHQRRRYTAALAYDFVKERSRWESLVDWRTTTAESKPSQATGWVVPVATGTVEWKNLMSQYPELLAAPGGLLSQMHCIPLDGGTVLCVPIAPETSKRSRLQSRSKGMRKVAQALQQSGGKALPCDEYQLRLTEATSLNEEDCLLSYLLDSYSFDHYKTREKKKKEKHDPPPTLCFRSSDRTKELAALVRATYFAQDLISTPACHLTPGRLQQVVEAWTKTHPDTVTMETIVGSELLNYSGSIAAGHGCGMIYAVGQAAMNRTTNDDDRHYDERSPRLIRVQYRPPKTVNPTAAKLALVGKGVMYDTGGLNLKPGSSMLNMKKDMGGAAHALGLLSALVEQKYPSSIDLLIPTVENVVDAHSYRPGDVVTSVLGTTTEIGNTDAEGRLILGDALALASAENPDMIVDFATLTGAARVATGTDIVPFFCNHDGLSDELMEGARIEQDPMWPLPLYTGYRKRITTSSKIADLRNVPSDNGLGGAITAALYLQEFVDDDIPWIHCDVYALEGTSGIGRAQGLRAMYRFLWDHVKEKT